MDFWKRAQELKDEITQNRRHIHQSAEVGLTKPKKADILLLHYEICVDEDK